MIEIKFLGDIRPNAIGLDELSSEILLPYALLKPIIEEKFSNITLRTDFLRLVDIGNRSLSFRYLINDHITVVKQAYAMLLTAIDNHEITTLPARTIEALEKTSDFNHRHRVTLHFGEVVNDSFVSYTSFSDEFTADKISILEGPSTLYGYLQWIGGTTPCARLVLHDKSEIKVNLTKEQAQAYSHYLYSYVTVEGVATWKGPNLKLTSIEAKAIDVFENVAADEGFDFLKKNLGKYWNDKDTNLYN